MTTAASGGSGGRRDVKAVRLVARALRERWPIPAESRAPIIARLVAVVRDPAATAREATAAAKALLQASRLNLEVVNMTIRADEHEELRERVAELERRQAREDRSRDSQESYRATGTNGEYA